MDTIQGTDGFYSNIITKAFKLTKTTILRPISGCHYIPSLVRSRRNREYIAGLQHIRLISRAKDLPLLALPLRLVDAINPVLNFEDEATVLLDDARAAIQTLGRLDGQGTYFAVLASRSRKVWDLLRTVLPTAGVDLEGVLV